MIIRHRTPEWYRARIGKFTASNFADLMAKPADGSSGWSKSAMKCIEDLAFQMHENAYHEKPDNDATRWGIRYEPDAIREFSEISGYEVVETGFVLHPELSEVGATPDTIVIENGQRDNLVIAQIKCPYCSRIHLDYIRKIKDASTLKKSKLHYHWQIQGELWVTGASHSYFVSYDPRLSESQQLHYVKIERDEEAINQLKTVILKAIRLRNEISEKYKNNTYRSQYEFGNKGFGYFIKH
ncbi:MAG: YqaJ viral recombinase family protein [Bacteroidales bacterium]|nr:YqaJ viral recombinase family protein [Bacteroidales bacterium]